MAILRYEERVRIERANGLRKPDTCVKGGCGCSVYGDDSAYAGKTFSEIAETPLRLNAVCPHPKVVVPVTGAFVVEEPAKTITPKYPAEPYQLVDGNPCDGRMIGVLETINDSRSNVEVVTANTVVTLGETVVDTAFDEPNKVRTVKGTIKKDKKTKQPVAVNETEVAEVPLSDVDDGANAKPAPAEPEVPSSPQ